MHTCVHLRVLIPMARVRMQKALRNGLGDRCEFQVRRNDIRILSGVDEGTFGWVAVNLLLGRLGRNAQVGGKATVGCLDMGGGSAQIAFEVYGTTNCYSCFSSIATHRKDFVFPKLEVWTWTLLRFAFYHSTGVRQKFTPLPYHLPHVMRFGSSRFDHSSRMYACRVCFTFFVFI